MTTNGDAKHEEQSETAMDTTTDAKMEEEKQDVEDNEREPVKGISENVETNENNEEDSHNIAAMEY